ncbi:MAG: hypothetical protein TREMPRED_001957 [Tremellales sp. Tagirdzhanova-0007]|nr:MAG: hypothetical protein TREMPRED_001957 [Tremellales sp. Tagirdzhanova-0007]
MPRSADDQRPLLRSSQAESPYGATGEQGTQKKKFKEIWPLCIGLWTAVFCSALGATIVSNLQIEIGSYFRHGSLSSWLGTSFLTGLTVMTPLYGRLAMIMGRKAAIMMALTFFFVGTISCALAPTMSFILAARSIAGMGSAGMLTVTAIIISDLVSVADRGLYQGGVNVLYGAGSATGAVVGGAIADRYGWRMAFWFQIPAISTAAFLIFWNVNVPHPETTDCAWTRFRRIDWAGSFVLVIAISSFTIASSLKTSSGYPFAHPLVYGLAILCVMTTLSFVWIENKALEPILPMSLLTRLQPSLVLAAFIYMQPVYLHVTRGLNGSQTGLLLLPSDIVGSASSLYAGWHMRHFKEYKWFQAILSVVPWLQAINLVTTWGPETSPHLLWFGMAIGATGAGVTITALLTALISTVSSEDMSLAISAAYLFRAIGQVIGVSAAGAIQQSILHRSLSSRLENYPEALIHSIIQEPAKVIPYLEAGAQLQAKLAYLSGIRGVFTFTIIGGVALTAICISIRAHPL